MMNDGEPVIPVNSQASVGNLKKKKDFERNQPKEIPPFQVSLQRHYPKTHYLLASLRNMSA